MSDIPRITALERELADARKEAADARRRAADVLDRITEIFVALDREWRVTYANAAALRILSERGGTDPAQVVGRKVFDVVEPSEHSGFRGRYLQALTAQRPVVFEEYYEPFGVWLEVHVWPSPEGLSILMTDITERRRVEAERERAERLDSLGMLAAGIAHDFNNLLSAIQGNIALSRKVRPEQRDERLDAAEEACARAADLSRRMLTFARGGAPTRQPTDLTVVLREQAELASRGSPVRLDLQLPEQLRPVHADPVQLGQVVQNLVLNAVQAMPQGGSIRVSAVEVPGAVQVEIADTGPGIPREHLQHIFDPFFTTKPTGTGLGLATAWSVVRRHGGTLEVASTSAAGTTFRFLVPTAPSAPQPGAPAPSKPHRRGRALVLDDDDAVREVTTLALRALGFTVDAVPRGEDAVVRFAEARTSGEPFDVVLLDLTIAGGLGGQATLEQLQRIDPDVVAVVTSGYSDRDVLADPTGHGFAAALAKPFTLDDLASALARAGL